MKALTKIQMKYWIYFLVLLFCMPVCTLAQSRNDSGSQLSAPLEKLRAKGSEAVLNLDYEDARRTFTEMTRLFPADPIGPQMLAWTLWLETLNKTRLRHAAIYSSQSFEANSEDKPDPQVTQEFRDLIRQATQLARARLQRSPHDPQMLYSLGAVETLRAGYELTVEGRTLAGSRDGSSGVDRHREAIKLDSTFHDAELSIGLYDYIVGNLPLAAKLFASLTGARGSKKRGLQTLERVAKEGHWERDNAALLLMALYKHEKRFADSLVLSRALAEKYPRNYLFKLETADTLILEAIVERQSSRTAAANALEKEALTVFDSLIRERSPSNASARALGVIHFRYGEARLILGQPERAAQEFIAATAANGSEAGLITQAHLRAAQSFDLAGKRAEALSEYQVVAERPNTRNSFEQARRGLKEPYKQPK